LVTGTRSCLVGVGDGFDGLCAFDRQGNQAEAMA